MVSIDFRDRIAKVAAMNSAPPDRQDHVLDAAFHVFATYGYRRVTMDDIARAAGLSRTALYLHFRNKEDIFRSLSDRYFRTCVAAMARALAAAGPDEVVLASAFAAKDGPFMEVVLGTPHGQELMDAGFSVAADIAMQAEEAMVALLAGWLAIRGADEALGGAATAATTVFAALKGLKTSSRTITDYRAGQAVLARMVARSLVL
jgi:AcrR family transcriptional regulator